MFLLIVKDSFARQPRRKLLTAATLALGTAVTTATLSVALDVGDRLSREFRSLGANLLVTPQADTLPLEIGGVDYRPVDSGAYLPESELGKLKTIFWRNNIIGFAPFLNVPVTLRAAATTSNDQMLQDVTLIGTWYRHDVAIPGDESNFRTGVAATHPWWSVEGRWFGDQAAECVVGTAFARRADITIGETIELWRDGHTVQAVVVGILSTGGQEDDAVMVPLATAQRLSNRPGQYRRLVVSALTKHEDALSNHSPATMTPAEYDRWYCSPYISSISHQMKEQLVGVEVRPIRRVAESEGHILSRVGVLMWLVTGAALLAATLAVAATAGTTVLERTGEIGLMKALGASRLMIGAFFLGEQCLLALMGGAAGYIVGLGLAQGLGQRVFGMAPETRMILLPIVLGVAVAVTTMGSILALAKVVRLEPASVLHGE